LDWPRGKHGLAAVKKTLQPVWQGKWSSATGKIGVNGIRTATKSRYGRLRHQNRRERASFYQQELGGRAMARIRNQARRRNEAKAMHAKREADEGETTTD